MARWKIAAAVGLAAVLVGGWYLFRPERAFIDMRVSEAAPARDMTDTLRVGSFSPRAHDGRGTVRILRLQDGRVILRFTEFETLNGPDLRVYLLGATDANNATELRSAGFVDLGPLKGNVGDQNYEIPAGTVLEQQRAVSVWCRRFGVNFTVAPLDVPPPSRGSDD